MDASAFAGHSNWTWQDASQQALNEFTQLKGDFERESNIKRQQEFTIVSLMKKSGGLLSRKEIDKLAYLRVELERTCKELVHYRDKIAAAIDESTASRYARHVSAVCLVLI